MTRLVFQAEEDAAIRRLWPDFAAMQAALPGRTELQIRRRGWKIGASRPATPIAPRFTAEQDATIRRLYPDMDALQRAFPDRSEKQLRVRAWTIGASARETFTPDDDAVIRELFPDIDAIHARLPRWEPDALRRRAYALGLTVCPRYTAAEKRLIRIFTPHYDLLCALLPEHRRKNIMRAASTLGVARLNLPGSRCREWTPEEIEAASQPGGRVPGRSTSAVGALRRRLGIRVARRKAEPKPIKVRVSAPALAVPVTAPAPAPPAPPPPPPVERPVPAFAPPPTVEPSAAVRPLPTAPAVKRHPPYKRAGRELDPRVIAAASRSPHGFDLIGTVDRAVPRDVWPHVRPLVVEDLVCAVVERRLTLADLPAAVPDAVGARMRSQFGGVAA